MGPVRVRVRAALRANSQPREDSAQIARDTFSTAVTPLHVRRHPPSSRRVARTRGAAADAPSVAARKRKVEARPSRSVRRARRHVRREGRDEGGRDRREVRLRAAQAGMAVLHRRVRDLRGVAQRADRVGRRGRLRADVLEARDDREEDRRHDRRRGDVRGAHASAPLASPRGGVRASTSSNLSSLFSKAVE
eukprot:30827-Pelagococcus_subviridis.AAC.8